MDRRTEVMQHIEPFVAEAIPKLTMSEDDYWQPSDFMPDMRDPDAFDRIRELQQQSAELSEDILVVLIGDMITEEALPTYSTWIGTCRGFDEGGGVRNSWGDWLRKWTSEENRHGDALNRYLYLSGRVNMREVEVTIQNLLTDGGDTQTANDPYRVFTYTSFQEIATRISHKNVAVRARKAGDDLLGRLCGFIAADENRHATAYKTFFREILAIDPSEAILAFEAMMRSKITMPAMYMRERGKAIGETFRKFEVVARRNAIYTPFDYADIVEHLVNHWKIADFTNLTGPAASAQDYLCGLAERYRKVAQRFAGKESSDQFAFAWLDACQTQPR